MFAQHYIYIYDTEVMSEPAHDGQGSVDGTPLEDDLSDSLGKGLLQRA